MVGFEMVELFKPFIGVQLYVKPATVPDPNCAEFPVQNCTLGPAFAIGGASMEILEVSMDVPHSFVTETEILSTPALAKPILGLGNVEFVGLPLEKDQL